jgi:uncharacterized membrane protein
MNVDPLILLTILGMGIVTYLTRVSGFLLLSGRRFGPRMSAAFDALPPAVLTAVIVPSIFLEPSGYGLRALLSPEILAAAIAVAAAYRLPFLAVIVIGTLSVVVLRWLMA